MYIKELKEKIANQQAKVGIIGLGYVGLPLLTAFSEKGFSVMGFDIDKYKVGKIIQGESYIRHIPSEKLGNKLISATTDMNRLHEADILIICVPTPLNLHREPDLTYVLDTTQAIAKCLREGQLIVLESTTYPGTTDEVSFSSPSHISP